MPSTIPLKKSADGFAFRTPQGSSFFFGSSVSIRLWTYRYVRYCRSAMVQKIFSTGPVQEFLGEQNEKRRLDGLVEHPTIAYSILKWF